MLASDAASTSTTSQPLRLQERLALSAKVIFTITVVFWAYLRTIALMDPNTGMTHAFTDVSAWLHLSAGLVHGAIWFALSRGAMPSGALRGLDVVNTLLPSALYAAMAAVGSTLDIEFAMICAVMLTVLTRAILVPSSGRRTLIITALAGVPVVMASALIHREGGAIYASVFASVTLAWMTATSALATVASSVIYGLRRQVRRAMQLGQYTLLEKLGEGGMGAVYRAEHAMLRRPTAIKLLPPEKLGDMAVERFEREVQLTAELTHPNTIRIYDYGRTADGVFYYAMELLEGATLGEVVDTMGPLPPERVVMILEQVAGALREAHGEGLIHRDIKPANILLCRQGATWDVAKVVDFGLVKQLQGDADPHATDEATVLGTPLYMAPEAIVSADTADGRSDIYALGAVGYFLLTGTDLFDGKNAVEVLSHHLHTPPEAPSKRLGSPVPAELEQLIMECLAKDPDERPRDAATLRDRLRSLTSHAEWTEEDAAAWWSAHGDVLQRSRVAVSDTVAIEVARLPG